jgi:hypothetical protein
MGMKILDDLSFCDSLTIKDLGEVSTKYHYQFSSEVVGQTVRLIKRDIDSGYLSMLGDEYGLSAPE